ncbi:MAG: helix-turn-helix transcriptional regulator [Xanthobacteraceae bacterium]
MPKASDLTPPEIQVLKLLAQGKQAQEIAGLLGITKRTVDAHTHAVITKLGAVNTPQAVAIAIQQGLITL